VTQKQVHTKFPTKLCMSLCEFVYLHGSEGTSFGEKPKRSPKTASFDRSLSTKFPPKLCLTIIIIGNIMYIIIYIEAKFPTIVGNQQSFPPIQQSLVEKNGGAHLS